MNIRKIAKRAFSILLYCFVVASMTWTFVSVIVFIAARAHTPTRQSNEFRVWPEHGAQLPRYSGDSSLIVLADGLESFAEAMLAKSDSLGEAQLVNASISFSVVDATYFYRLIFVGECGCPLTITDRYEIDLAYMNPRTHEIFREERHRGLSAEDVKRFDEVLSFEGR